MVFFKTTIMLMKYKCMVFERERTMYYMSWSKGTRYKMVLKWEMLKNTTG